MIGDDNRDGDQPETSNASPPVPSPTQQILHTISSIKFLILRKGEYDIWAMKMEHYLSHTDYPIWQVIQNGNGTVSVTTDTNGMIKVLPPKTAEEINDDDIEEMDLKWQDIDWSGHVEKDAQNYAMMALSSSNSGSDSEAKYCSKTCEESYARLKKLYDEQRDKLGDASVEITTYTLALKKVEAQLLCHQQNQLVYEQKIRFMKIYLDDKTDVLTYHKKLLTEALKENEDLKTKFENWQNSSKNLSRLLNTQMSANDKFGLGYGDYIYGSILSYKNEVLQSVFMNKESDLEDTLVNDRYADGMHAVPPPMTRNYMPSGLM
uniref:Ribonuclease H-like domain-containing protein n=1 Tax=Tanacetum cinerariifolium TaxID=118510 RepID=A0A699H8A6_TANCI|nr:ribonuclease H-like domain-containing protein [Tanacetum cinerariifolium]